MKFLVYSSTTSENIESTLGGVDYSYFFVLKSYLPLLRQFGEVEVLAAPPIRAKTPSGRPPEDSYYFSFTPPNRVELDTGMPVVPVFAWEFGTLPDEAFVSEKDNWKTILGKAGQAITHSQYAVQVVRNSLGDSYPIVSIPAPIWDGFDNIRQQRAAARLHLDGLGLGATVVDSDSFRVSNGQLIPAAVPDLPGSEIIGKIWNGDEFDLDCSTGTQLPPYSGFMQGADGKLWSVAQHPWIVLPCYLSGPLILELELESTVTTNGQNAIVHLGSCSALVGLTDAPARHRLAFDLHTPCNVLHFSAPDVAVEGDNFQICVHSISVREPAGDVSDLPAGADLICDESVQWWGVHAIEPWGRWTGREYCSAVLPTAVSGEVVVTFTIKESMMNAGGIIDVTLGGQVASVQLSGPNQEVELKFDNVAYTDDLRIRGLDAKSPIGSQETRLLGLALSGLSVVAGSREADLPRRPFSEFVSGLMARKRRFFAKNANSIAAASVVYTTVFNPIDGRKNWPDIIKAFVFALRENAGALLIVKITHSELQPFLGDLCSYLVSMAPFQCRIVFLHGYLDDDEYQNLIRATSFIVNASKGEGQCLPLMEFMSSGVPAIAPDNTAMSDYISSQNAFVVKSSIEPAVWPQDPRLLFRTTRYRINWESLYDAFKESYRLAVSRKQDYALMSKASIAALQQYCSMESATERMREFLGSSGPGGAG